jgi:hypothetical protein
VTSQVSPFHSYVQYGPPVDGGPAVPPPCELELDCELELNGMILETNEKRLDQAKGDLLGIPNKTGCEQFRTTPIEVVLNCCRGLVSISKVDLLRKSSDNPESGEGFTFGHDGDSVRR